MTPSQQDLTTPEVAARLRACVADYSTRYAAADDESFAARHQPTKWSRKEILGHLIDSANNNLRRFIVAQYVAEPPHIVYDQDFWVAVNQYNAMSVADLVALWKLLNERIAMVLEQMPGPNQDRLCNTGKGNVELHTLRFLAADYLAHMKHHLLQIEQYTNN